MGDVTRHSPHVYPFGGMEIRVGTYKSNGRVDITYKAATAKKGYTQEYVPVLPDKSEMPATALQIHEHLPPNVVYATLREKLPTLFLPKLFAAYPAAKSGDIHFALMARYALHQVHTLSTYSDHTKANDRATLDLMIDLWGDKPMCQITPHNCAEDLTKMSKTTAANCIRVLRKIYPVAMATLVDNVELWSNYSQPRRRGEYSPQQRARKMLLHAPLPPRQIQLTVMRCWEAILSNNEAAKHLAALIILLLGVAIEEVCALRLDALVELPYKGYFALLIDRVVVTQGKRKSNDGHVRGHRHIISRLDEPQRRPLGVSKLLWHLWITYREMNPARQDNQLLLANPDNPDRVYAPEEFEKWINANFKDLLPDDAIILGGQEIRATYSAVDYFFATAEYLLSDQAGYCEEETRYHWGESPQSMDAKHYVGFSSPTELVTQAVMQERALDVLRESSAAEVTAKHIKVPGRGGYTIRVRVELDMQNLESKFAERALIARIKSLGNYINFSFEEKDEIV